MKSTNDSDASKPDDTPRKLMNVDRLKAMGWKAKTAMREGLAVAYRYFLVTFGLPPARDMSVRASR